MEIYKAKLKHDKGTMTLVVSSQNGKRGAIRQITTTEGCPECAIMEIVKINNKAKQ